MIKTIDDLENWLKANEEHALAQKLWDELALCQCLRKQMCNHVGDIKKHFQGLPGHIYQTWLVDEAKKFNLDPKDEVQVLLARAQKELLEAGHNPEAAKLGLCEHDYELYNGIRLSIDYCNQLLGYKN